MYVSVCVGGEMLCEIILLLMLCVVLVEDKCEKIIEMGCC